MDTNTNQNNMKKNHSLLFVLTILVLICISCQKEPVQNVESEIAAPLITRSISPTVFDWETADFMPTPTGQSQISVPWIGSGSLAGSHTLDVLNDYKKSDGWRLLYSTFSDNSTGTLVNPYFILYNVYRGTMRVYLYVTTQFAETSSYLRDELSVSLSPGTTTNLLSFTQGGIIDPSANITRVSQVQPKPLNGGAPFASNKWYMMEYELAYDSDIDNLSYQNIQLVWQLDFSDVSSISLNGNSSTSINSVVSSTSENNPFNILSDDAASQIAEGAISIGSMNYMQRQKTNKKYLGLSENTFNLLYNGVTSAVSSISSGMPKFVVSVLSSVFGGSSSSSSPIINLKADSKIEITGTSEVSGSFPSMPISWYVPGSRISSSAPGYVPLERESLGVIGWKGSNAVTVDIDTDVYYLPDDIMNTGVIYEHRASRATLSKTDFSSNIEINPAVLEVADVEIVSHDVVAYAGKYVYSFPMKESIYDNPWESPDVVFPDYNQIISRFIIKVEPKDGSPATYIYKSFDMDYKVEHNYKYHY